MPHAPITSCAHMRHLLLCNTSYEPNAINNVIRSTSIYTFTLLTYAPNKYVGDIGHKCPTTPLI